MKTCEEFVLSLLETAKEEAQRYKQMYDEVANQKEWVRLNKDSELIYELDTSKLTDSLKGLSKNKLEESLASNKILSEIIYNNVEFSERIAIYRFEWGMNKYFITAESNNSLSLYCYDGNDCRYYSKDGLYNKVRSTIKEMEVIK